MAGGSVVSVLPEMREPQEMDVAGPPPGIA